MNDNSEPAIFYGTKKLKADLPHDGTETVIELLPHIDMRSADGTLVVGWLASQTDMLSDDWQILN